MLFRAAGIFLRPLVFSLPERAGVLMLRHWPRVLGRKLEARLTDEFLELLLRIVDLSLSLSKDFRRNIENFKGRYLFQTSNKDVVASAVFEDGEMRVYENTAGIRQYDVTVTFMNSAALRRFIFSRDLDILNLVLENEVQVDGNLNYVYKFLFIAKDLLHRLGL
jgi:hypothetical protein